MADLTNSRSASAGLADRIAAFVADLRQTARRRALYTRTLRELNALTDRELTDLGISRLQIEDVARTAAYGK
jgi:uncharacterized protein YjiS (DUF1127 family)